MRNRIENNRAHNEALKAWDKLNKSIEVSPVGVHRYELSEGFAVRLEIGADRSIIIYRETPYGEQRHAERPTCQHMTVPPLVRVAVKRSYRLMRSYEKSEAYA